MEFLNQLKLLDPKKSNQILHILSKYHQEHGLLIQELETVLSPVELQQFIQSIQQNTLEKSMDLYSKLKHLKALELLQSFQAKQISRDECIQEMKNVLPSELFDEFMEMMVPTITENVQETTPLISKVSMTQKKTYTFIPIVLICFLGIIVYQLIH